LHLDGYSNAHNDTVHHYANSYNYNNYYNDYYSGLENIVIFSKISKISEKNQTFFSIFSIYKVSGKKGATLFLPVTPRNSNRFSKFFYIHALQ